MFSNELPLNTSDEIEMEKYHKHITDKGANHERHANEKLQNKEIDFFDNSQEGSEHNKQF